MRQGLAEVLTKYRDRGVLKSSDFLLKPDDAAALIEDLANVGVLIIGCDLWRPWDEARSNWVELVGGGDLVNYRLSNSDAHWNAAVVRDFISDEWPNDAERISFVYADEEVWDSILDYLRCSSTRVGGNRGGTSNADD